MNKLKRLFLFFFAFALQQALLEARNLTLENFDDVRSSPFAFKDDKGSRFKTGTPTYDSIRNHVLQLEYQILNDGWAGWGLALKGLDASNYTAITFMVRGRKGGETFEIGLKDKENIEKKLAITQFSDIEKDWRKVKIPLKEFENVDLSKLDNLNLGFLGESGEGTVYLDEIQFEIADLTDEDRLRSGTFSNKIVVDNFERANPTDIYLIYEGDDSSLKLNSSRIVKDGSYSMELEYTLSSSRPWGSWVSGRWQSKESTLDWRGVSDVKMWVKGDGSGNIFRFLIVDEDGERWVYEDANVLKLTAWEQLAMPLKDFVLDEKSLKKNGTLDPIQVRAYEIGLRGMGGSNTTTGVKTTVGKIQVDQLAVSGDQINTVWAIPPVVQESQKLIPLKVGNIDFNGQLFTEFLNAPEQKSTVSHFGKIISNGKVGNYSARVEFASEGQEFSEAAYFNVAQSTASGTTATTQSPKVVMTSFQLQANNISPYLTLVTVGNLFVDYTPFTFAPVFGFKGLSAEGDVDLLNYHCFVLKHRFDSFTAGARGKLFWENFRFNAIAVYYREMAKVADAADVSGTTVKSSSDLRLEEVQNDSVVTLDGARSFWEDKITFGGTFGINRYTQKATANRSNPYEPIFGNLLTIPLAVEGKMARGRAELNQVLIPGLKLNYEYRTVDTEFKPRYRQSPIVFDDLESDQLGHNLRAVQSYRGFVTSAEYDTMNRASDQKYYRRRFIWALGYYGFDKLDVAFNQEVRREEYNFVSNRTSVSYIKNEKQITSELYIRAQLTPKTALFLRPRREDIEHPASGLTFANESLYGKIECYASTNLKLQGEFRTTHFGVKDFEPKGFPFEDNFVRITIEFNF